MGGRRAAGLASAGKLEAAAGVLAEALEGEPRWAAGRHRLAEVQIAQGDIEDGLRSCQRALEDDPGLALAYETLALATRAGPEDEPWIVRIEEQLGVAGRTPSEVAALHFAAAKMLDDLGRVEPAFAHLEAGNAAVRATLRFDIEAVRARVDALIGAFGAGLLASRGEGADPSELPVLVVGMPRSGTTLVEQILAAHPEVRACGELEYLDKLRVSVDGVPFPACPARTAELPRSPIAAGHLVAPGGRGAGRAVAQLPLHLRANCHECEVISPH